MILTKKIGWCFCHCVKFYTKFKITFNLRTNDWIHIRNVSNQKETYAFLIGYNGKGYSGLQRNFGKLTVEEEVLRAFLKIGLITRQEFENSYLIKLQRTSRTDSGVSAVKQIIAINTHMIENFIEQVNFHLPESIQIFGFKKVMNDFDCWKDCSGRIYEYLIPTFAFAPLEKQTLENFQISDSTLTKLNQVLEIFKGSHKFHNFTREKSKHDDSSLRYVTDISCSRPFMLENIQFLTIYIKGQSFLLHQIRKMIGLTITVIRGLLPDEMITKAFEEEYLMLPKAPPLGLMLDDMFFDKYHRRLGRRRIREALLWNDDINTAVLKFKENCLYPSIAKTEKNDKITLKWLETLMNFSFDNIGSHTIYYYLALKLNNLKNEKMEIQ